MYIHLGQDTVIKKRDIIGIFDLDTASVSRHTRKFLNMAQKRGQVINVSYELPKAFVVCQKKNTKGRVYISQLSPTTLQKRNEFLNY